MSDRRTMDRLATADAKAVLGLLRDHGAENIHCKVLAPNDNSKNQIWLASDLAQLSWLPAGEVVAHPSNSLKKGVQAGVFHAPLDFQWLDLAGRMQRAPGAQLIVYPQYPEVRLSGFLRGCAAAPSTLFAIDKRGREAGRVLLLGVSSTRQIIAMALPADSPAAETFRQLAADHPAGQPFRLLLGRQGPADDREVLLRELCRVHREGWIAACRLDSNGCRIACRGSNCHGNTLEAMLGIRPNGLAKPDFLGWEIKSRLVSRFGAERTSTVTLFTPEPTGGFYASHPVAEFVRRYGYGDRKNRPDRLNFGGTYRVGGAPHPLTGLRIVLDGYDSATGTIDPGGALKLIDRREAEAATWPFAKLLDHWRTKHARAAYVPAIRDGSSDPARYRFGQRVLLAEGAEFRRLLSALASGTVYYDPGIKLEAASSARPLLKRRSQFRLRSGDLATLYVRCSSVDVCGDK